MLPRRSQSMRSECVPTACESDTVQWSSASVLCLVIENWSSFVAIFVYTIIMSRWPRSPMYISHNNSKMHVLQRNNGA